MKLETKTCRYGEMTYLPNDVFIGRSLQVYGEYSEFETMWIRLLLRPGDVAVDVGANIGVLTVPMAQFVGPTGLIHAFEPQREIHEILGANITQNGLKHVVLHPTAVGAAPGSIRVPHKNYEEPDNFGGVELGSREGEDILVETIDSLRLPRLRLIKIDVEGMELEVLKGAQDTIRRCEPAIYVENDRRERSAELINALHGFGYRLWWFVTPLFNPDNFLRNATDIFGKWSINMIGFPRTASILLPFAEVRGPEDVPRLANGEVFKIVSH